MEWALLLMALFVALILRFYLLGEVPLGLYRDEAINGLDALDVLRGKFALFFPANNGREPLYIYLTAGSIALFGQTTFAVRFAAAAVGSLTTLPVYMLGKSWFNWRVGVLAAWVWAITIWPIHLSRIGLRTILLVPLLTLAFWLGTSAYRQQKKHLWFLTGMLYGFTFYTYLAARFTPLILAMLLFFLLFTGRKNRLWPGAAWFLLGTFLTLLPAFFLLFQQPDLLAGRSGQVSVLHPDVNDGDLFGTFWRHIWATAAMFIWQGDTILRHNPAGRPVFDWLMAVPFLIGVVWTLRNWRRPAAAALLIWITVMLGPTILAADAPHFLRAAGVLPAVVYLPAVGFDQILLWPRLAPRLRLLLVIGLLSGSLLLTTRDYAAYARDPQVANAFEFVAADLAQQINHETAESDIYLDEKLWSDWPSLPFLVADPGKIQIVVPSAELPQRAARPLIFYLWPYEPMDFIPEIMASPGLITANGSDRVYGELDDSVYQLFVRYQAEEIPPNLLVPVAEFEDGLRLQSVDVSELSDGRLQVDVYWQSENSLDEELVVFVHVLHGDQLLGQHDASPAEGHWLPNWWRPGQIILDRHVITLAEPYDNAQHQVLIGLYRASTGARLPAFNAATGESLGTAFTVGSQ